MSYLIFICCTLLGTIGFILWSNQKTNRYANRLLSLLLFVYAYINFVTVLLLNGTLLELPHLFRTAAPLHFAVGPLILLYVRATIIPVNRFNFRSSLLFIPVLLSYVNLIPLYRQSADYKISILKNIISAPNSIVDVSEGWVSASTVFVSSSVLNLIYVLLAVRLVWNYRRQFKTKISTNIIFRKWITTFTTIHLIAHLIWITGIPIFHNTRYANDQLLFNTLIPETLICLYIFRKPTLLYGTNNKLVRIESPPHNPTRSEIAINLASQFVATETADNVNSSRKSILNKEIDIQEKVKILEEYMVNNQPYLQPRLTLPDVAVATGVSLNLLSAILNQTLGVEFRDYVNSYRIQHVIGLLDNNQHNTLTMEGIASIAGFSSRTTFYRAFQKHTGLTPSQYLIKRENK